MECQFGWGDAPRRTSIHRLFSVNSLVSVLEVEDIHSRGIKWEQYNFWQLFYLREGEGRYCTEDGNEYSVRAGQAFFRPPHKKSAIVYGDNTRNVVYIVSFECASRAMNELRCMPIQLYGEENAAMTDVIQSGVRIFEPVKGKGREQGLQLKEGVSTAVLGYVACSLERFLYMMYCRSTAEQYYPDESEKVNRHIMESRLTAEIREYLRAHVNGNPTIDEIAEQFGINPVTMMKLFKRETGESIISCLTMMKLREAMRMISDSSMNFSEISEKLGFSSVSYFSRKFREKTGMTPTEFSRHQSKKR